MLELKAKAKSESELEMGVEVAAPPGGKSEAMIVAGAKMSTNVYRIDPDSFSPSFPVSLSLSIGRNEKITEFNKYEVQSSGRLLCDGFFFFFSFFF